MKKHIYLAGSLFSEAEVNQRLKEGKILNDSLSETHTYFNPIEAPINDKAKLPTSLDIFMGDTLEVLKSDVVIADLANEDAGVMMELGIAWALDNVARLLEGAGLTDAQKEYFTNHGVKEKKVYAVLSDIRVGTAGEYNGIDIPFGYNQYVIGGIKNMGGRVYSKFSDVVDHIKVMQTEVVEGK